MTVRGLLSIAAISAASQMIAGVAGLEAQVPFDGEVRQLVTFQFQPGGLGEALTIYERDVLPLYRRDHAMRSLRAFREVESPVPLDLILVRGFDGMAGMDASNEALRGIAESAGTSMGRLYGSLSAVATGHHDQFVEMMPDLGSGDPTQSRLVALVWYRFEPGAVDAARDHLAEIAAWDNARGHSTSTGRFLLSDGWHVLRMIGLDSLGDYQEYLAALRRSEAGRSLERLTLQDRTVLVGTVPALSIRQE